MFTHCKWKCQHRHFSLQQICLIQLTALHASPGLPSLNSVSNLPVALMACCLSFSAFTPLRSTVLSEMQCKVVTGEVTVYPFTSLSVPTVAVWLAAINAGSMITFLMSDWHQGRGWLPAPYAVSCDSLNLWAFMLFWILLRNIIYRVLSFFFVSIVFFHANVFWYCYEIAFISLA